MNTVTQCRKGASRVARSHWSPFGHAEENIEGRRNWYFRGSDAHAPPVPIRGVQPAFLYRAVLI